MGVVLLPRTGHLCTRLRWPPRALSRPRLPVFTKPLSHMQHWEMLQKQVTGSSPRLRGQRPSGGDGPQVPQVAANAEKAYDR